MTKCDGASVLLADRFGRMLAPDQVLAQRPNMPLDDPGGALRDGLLTTVFSGFYLICLIRS